MSTTQALPNDEPFVNTDEQPQFLSENEDTDTGSSLDDTERVSSKANYYRNLVGFWILGMCNNYAYVIMLSAATDILKTQYNTTSDSGANKTSPNNSALGKDLHLDCNPTGTGAVLLADILPTLLVKTTAPFFVYKISYNIRISVVILLAAASFVTVAFSPAIWISFLGVVFASLSSGLGELTFLQLTAHFHSNVVSTYASGTGGSGIVGAVSYAALRTAGVSPQNTVLIMLFVPGLMAASYFGMLMKPSTLGGLKPKSEETVRPLIPSTSEQKKGIDIQDYTLKEKIFLIKPLLKYMIPLMLVYLAEYSINQTLFELMVFEGIWLPKKTQYFWYQVDYQLGVFISRSSVNIFPVNKLWVLPIIQFANLALFTSQVLGQYIPSIWIILGLILFEGLIGGCAYVNTFHKIRTQTDPAVREFSLGVGTVGDTLGIVVAGAIGIPIHNYLCSL